MYVRVKVDTYQLGSFVIQQSPLFFCLFSLFFEYTQSTRLELQLVLDTRVVQTNQTKIFELLLRQMR